ncbi:hypothetical protein EHS39_09130 [Ensifer sp. MPMI2T]|nr:hypothetical protein EHS39_09130 [Ensifer sp. MPMI2T]
MKEYRVKFGTVIEGKHAAEGSTVRLADDKAKVYQSAGLIAEVDADGNLIEAADADGKKKPEAKAESKA